MSVAFLDKLVTTQIFGRSSFKMSSGIGSVGFLVIPSSFSWQEGDIVILDNYRMGHGRLPFTGERQVYIAFS